MAVVSASVAAAGSGAASQWVEIRSSGALDANPSASGSFVLRPVPSGVLAPDAGRTSSVWSERVAMRARQSIEVEEGVTTYDGRRGSFEVRYRIEYVEFAGDYHAGDGTWKLVRATGQYARMTGRGRIAGVWRERKPFPWWERLQGSLTRG